MTDLEKTVQLWLDGTVLYPDLPTDVRKHIDAMVDEVEKGDPTSYDVLEPTDKPKKKKKIAKEDAPVLVHKAQAEHRFTLGPWYIPNKPDAHNEWTDADELQKALWDYVRSGDRDIRLQHNRDIVAGEWVEAMSFPIPITMNMQKSDGNQGEVTYPAGTVFLGVQWKPWAWDLVKTGKITGFSIGGAAARVEMGVPADIEKRAFGNRSAAGRYAAEQRWRAKGGMDYPDKEKILSGSTRSVMVGGKERTFNTSIAPASSIKTGDVISGTTQTNPVKVVGRLTTDAKIGGAPTIGFIVHPLGDPTRRSTLSINPDKKVTVYTEAKAPAMAKALIPSGPENKEVEYKVVYLDTYVGKSKVRNVAGLYGPNGEVGIVRTDGERYWATGHSTLENLDYAIAQEKFSTIDKAKSAFGGNRSAAGAYAANIRWARSRAGVPDKTYRAATGVPDGNAPIPSTPEGMALGSAVGGAGSLVTHCDLDAVAGEMMKAGLKEPTADMYYKHLTPERRAQWDAAIAEKVNGVPINPDGPNAYMMGGGGASGKSSAIRDKAVNVPNADKAAGEVKAVDVNPDSAKEQIPGYRNMLASKDSRAANLHHEESAQIAALTGAAGLRQGSDIVVDGVADNGAAKTMGKVDNYRAMGAKRVELHVVTVDIDTARSRNQARAAKTGRLVHEPALIAGHKGVSKNFGEYAKSGKWDLVTVTDTNSGAARKIFEQGKGGRPRIIDRTAYQQFLDKQNYSG